MTVKRTRLVLLASPVVQSSNTLSCVLLSFRTHPCVLAIITHDFLLARSVRVISYLIVNSAPEIVLYQTCSKPGLLDMVINVYLVAYLPTRMQTNVTAAFGCGTAITNKPASGLGHVIINSSNNYSHVKLWNVIIRLCFNVNDSFVKPLLKSIDILIQLLANVLS